MSFVFYDTETTGLDRNFDQILHFAAIKTDWQLEEEDRFEIRCRLLPHVVPHPEALCTTRTPVDTLLDADLPSHYEMVCAIAEKLAEWSPATFIGYYSLGFDEHLLRSAFYQCLHYPYLTSTRPNTRADALAIVHAAAALAPNALSIPRTGEGRPSFTLAGIAAENGMVHAKAHDAMSDAAATLQVCQRLSRDAPSVWSNALKFSQRAAVVDFLEDEEAFVLTQTYSGEARHFCVAKIGSDPTDTNAAFVLDLAVDFDELRGLSDADLVVRLDASPKILRSIRANASPTLSALDEWGDFAGACADHWRERGLEIRGDVALRERLVAVRLASREPWPAAQYVEERIYEGRFPNPDAELMRAFHAAPWSDRWEIVRQFKDPRHRQLGARLVFFGAADCMPDQDRRRFERALSERLIGTEVDVRPWLTPSVAHAEIQWRLQEAEDDERSILEGLQSYLSERVAYARSRVGAAG